MQLAVSSSLNRCSIRLGKIFEQNFKIALNSLNFINVVHVATKSNPRSVLALKKIPAFAYDHSNVISPSLEL